MRNSKSSNLEDEGGLSCEQASIERSVLEGRVTSLGPGPALGGGGDDTPSLKSEDLYDEELAEAAMRSGIAEVIDLTEAEAIDLTDNDARAAAARQRKGRARKPERPPVPRNPPVLPQSRIGDDVGEYEGHLVPRRESLVEIQPIPHLWRASFLQVKDIFEASGGAVLRGLAFTRTRYLRGKLPRYRNELCLILQVDADDDRDEHLQAAVEVPLSHMVGVRKFHYTNTTFPDWRFQEHYETVEQIEDEATLTCRWKYRLVYKDAASRRRANAVPQEFVMSRIGYDEVPSKQRYRKADSHLMHEWRGGKVCGGSYDTRENRDIVLPVVLDEAAGPVADAETAGRGSLARKQPGQRYSLADMFCGAGGVSCGARAAGLHVKLACDHSKDACDTYRHHFAGTELREVDIFQFLAETPASCRVDVLHLSPPCQFWSPAHTVPGVNDEANIAALFACHHLLGLLKPRVFTLEQTYGILHPRFEYYFNALVQGFARHGYSVRWRIVNFINFGLPSVRNRLLVVGSCPGEALPPFPAYTHAAEPVPGVTKPYVGVLQAVARIPRSRRLSDPMHDIAMAKDRNQKPTNPHAPLTRTITCNGGYGNAHWTGQRDFTKREYATLNGFPARYRFFGSHPKRQIGNAFPPLVTHPLFKHIRAWLERADGVEPVEDEETPLGDPCDRDEVVLTPEQWASIEYDWDEAVPGSRADTAAGAANAPGAPCTSVPCIDWQQVDQPDEKKSALQWTLGTSDAPLDIDAGSSRAEAIELD